MNINKFYLQRFADEVKTTDVEPAISVDYTSKLVADLTLLRDVLGITELTPKAAGDLIKIYELKKVNSPAQVAEGEEIALTEISRKVVKTVNMTLNKSRKRTSAEAIQKTGKSVAVNLTDEKLLREIQKDIKGTLFDTLKAGTGTATGNTLQAACANLWAKVNNAFEDEDTSIVFFINPQDVADYLGTATVTTQMAFGLTYLAGFLGMGTAILSNKVAAKSPIATARENIGGAFIPVDGDVGTTFGLTADESGLVGMTHEIKGDHASIDTVIMSGVKFFADGVFVATIA